MNLKKYFLTALGFFILNSTAYADVQFGDSGAEVEELQRLLTEKNYLDGVDGVFGELTEQALKNFQRDNNLIMDGICGAETLNKLRATSENILQFGSMGNKVTELQNILIQLNHLEGDADGYFGAATETALKNFQAANNLIVDGICGEMTFNLLNNAEFLETATITGDGGVAEIGDIIKSGMHGEGVVHLQEILINRGFLDGDADGWCGAATVAAICDFQRSAGLPADGVCGISTYAALENSQYATRDTSWQRAVEAFPKFSKTIFVEATAYSADDPSANSHYTASGTLIRRGIIAVDPNVIPLGTRVYIPDYGEAVAEDTGSAIKGNKIDIAFDTLEEAMQFGRQNLQIYIISD